MVQRSAFSSAAATKHRFSCAKRLQPAQLLHVVTFSMPIPACIHVRPDDQPAVDAVSTSQPAERVERSSPCSVAAPCVAPLCSSKHERRGHTGWTWTASCQPPGRRRGAGLVQAAFVLSLSGHCPRVGHLLSASEMSLRDGSGSLRFSHFLSHVSVLENIQ